MKAASRFAKAIDWRLLSLADSHDWQKSLGAWSARRRHLARLALPRARLHRMPILLAHPGTGRLPRSRRVALHPCAYAIDLPSLDCRRIPNDMQDPDCRASSGRCAMQFESIQWWLHDGHSAGAGSRRAPAGWSPTRGGGLARRETPSKKRTHIMYADVIILVIAATIARCSAYRPTGIWLQSRDVRSKASGVFSMIV